MADPEQTEVAEAAEETERELMQGALEPEAPAEPPPEPERPLRTRNPDGTFAREQPAEPQQPAEAPAKPEDEVLPSWRAREINEERRRVQAENEAMRAEFARMQTRMAQYEQARQKVEAPPPPDPVLDPQGYTKHITEQIRAEFQQQQVSDRLSMNLEMAHMRYGELFEKAYEALLVEGQRGNQPLVRHFVAQSNPGQAIVNWYRQNEVMREVGYDIPAYHKKTEEQLLNNPEFLARAVERQRQIAMGGNGQPPNVVTKLPPSLSKATGMSADDAFDKPHTDGSEEQLFAYAMNAKRR